MEITTGEALQIIVLAGAFGFFFSKLVTKIQIFFLERKIARLVREQFINSILQLSNDQLRIELGRAKSRNEDSNRVEDQLVETHKETVH